MLGFRNVQVKEELDRLRREVVRSPKSPKTSLAAQAVLRRVENERDDALTELRRMSTERDTLRERLKVTQCAVIHTHIYTHIYTYILTAC